PRRPDSTPARAHVPGRELCSEHILAQGEQKAKGIFSLEPRRDGKPSSRVTGRDRPAAARIRVPSESISDPAGRHLARSKTRVAFRTTIEVVPNPLSVSEYSCRGSGASGSRVSESLPEKEQ